MKNIIVVKALAGKTNATDINILHEYEFHSEKAEFVQYLGEDFCHKLYDGYMSFVVEDGKLWVCTHYNLIPGYHLYNSELKQLAAYTQEQWDCGIGAGMGEYALLEEDGVEVFAEPFFKGQKVVFRQE